MQAYVGGWMDADDDYWAERDIIGGREERMRRTMMRKTTVLLLVHFWHG